MSPSTAPASTEASCSGSPRKIRRPSNRTASTRRAINHSDSMERLVDDHHVVGEGVAAVMAEPTGVVGPGTQQPVHGRGLEPVQQLAHRRSEVEAGGGRAHRFLHAVGRLAGWGGQGDQRRLQAGAGGLLGQQADQPGHGGRLAGSGAAGDHRQAAQRRHGDRPALLGVAARHRIAARSPPAGGRGSPSVRAAGVARAAPGSPPPPARRASSGRGRGPSRRGATAPPRGPRRRPPRGGWPPPGRSTGQARATPASSSAPSSSPSVEVTDRTARRSALTWPMRGARTANAAASATSSSSSPPSRPSLRATCTSAGASTPARLNAAEQRVAREPEHESRFERRRHRRPSKRSDRSVTNPAGGRQEKTPHGIPSTSGVPGPHMPRRKR